MITKAKATLVKVTRHTEEMRTPLPRKQQDRVHPAESANTAIGLGDAVASVATPIARVLRLSCIDPATKQLRPESGCAKRKAGLNKKAPNILRPFSSEMQPPPAPPPVAS